MKKCEIIYFAEYCYSVNSDISSKYGLYVYVYNPTEKAIAEDIGINKVKVAVEFDEDGRAVKYEEIGLEFLDKTENNRFYKFKLSESQHLLSMAGEYASRHDGVRKYELADLEIRHGSTGRINRSSRIYEFSGYGAYCDEDKAPISTLTCRDHGARLLYLLDRKEEGTEDEDGALEDGSDFRSIAVKTGVGKSRSYDKTKIKNDIAHLDLTGNGQILAGENGKETNKNSDSTQKAGFFRSTAFIFIVAVVAFIGMLALVLSVAFKGGLSLNNLLGGETADLDFKNDSLSQYIDIKESNYKGIEINMPVKGPTEADVDSEIKRLIATYRKGPVDTTQTWFYNRPLAIGDDALVYYVAYTLDEDGRKLVLNEASNHASASPYRYTLGTGSSVFGKGFDDALVGKYAEEGKGIGNIRDTAYVTDGCVIYATVSYVMDNGLIYDSVDVCIDTEDPEFEDKWGIGAKDLFCGYDSQYQKIIGTLLLTGNNYETFLLPDGRTITYTAVTVNYVTDGDAAPITVESTLSYDYAIEALRGKQVMFDVHIEKAVAYNVYDFDEDFITNKIGYPDKKYTAEDFAKYDGESAAEKYRSYLKSMLDASYEAYCRSYAEQYIWDYIKGRVVIKEYPQKEVDNVYLSWDKYYREQFAKAQAAGAGYESFDEYMAEIFELGEGGEWTSVLLADVKNTVKERLITYAILRDANILPSDEEFKRIFEEELVRDFNYANSISPGRFPTVDDYKEYIENDRGLSEYEHDVYYYYLTDKLVEMNLKP